MLQKEFLAMTQTPKGVKEALIIKATCVESAKLEVHRMWREVLWVIPSVSEVR